MGGNALELDAVTRRAWGLWEFALRFAVEQEDLPVPRSLVGTLHSTGRLSEGRSAPGSGLARATGGSVLAFFSSKPIA